MDQAPKQPTKSSPKNGPSDLVNSMSKINLDDENEEGDHTLHKRNSEQPARRLVIYPRPQTLKLSKSPLVKPPDNMPALKDWFGAENEQSMHKKDGEGSSPTGPRDRRFRRDPDDGDTPLRPSFRGTLTQPSQMGNFKHQSLRSTDRGDREKDGDKERERDARDKEGQERLRNLSDKYDRDRQALPSNLISLRNKERDSAPHLNASSSRVATRETPQSAASRRTEPREGSKKKTEASEDWRRGADPHRPGRDDRSENPRKDRDRDDRDRPRSQVRDNSRQRRERSSSRRDRDRSDRDRDRDRDRRGDGDRDDYRRDDYLRRDRDLEKDMEVDDPRRWRDDGKRDERLAARREREHRERVREKSSREEGWEPSSDRQRWTVAEERDGRNKRSSGRDRRSGVLDDGKEKDDRKDRDRDREREKEPAWMETYTPVDSAPGILGGKGGEDELDGIQAFKKDMKAKEQKDMPSSTEKSREADADRLSGSSKAENTSSTAPLDEIQLFRLMMKKEQKQKMPEEPYVSTSEPISTDPTLHELGNGAPPRIKDQRKISTISNGESAASSDPEPRSALDQSTPIVPPTASSSLPPVAEPALRTNSDAPQALLSILSSANGIRPAAIPTPNLTPSSLDTAHPKPTGSRFFPKPLPSDVPSPVTLDQGSPSSQAPPQFNPPPGSRLLAFGARNTSSTSGPQNTNQPPLQTSHNIHPSMQHHAFQSPSDAFQGAGSSLPQSDISHRPAVSEAMRAQRGFSPFELQPRTTFNFDESREPGNYGQTADSLRRTSVASPVDRALLPVTSDSNTGNNYFSANSDSFAVNGPGPTFDPTNNGPQYTSGKGSRFLKYFEDKGRDSQSGGIRKPQGPVGFQSSSPNLNQRQEQGGFNGMLGNGDNRSVDALVAMLSTSAQGQRVNTVNQMGPGVTPGSHFGQHNNLQSLHHQHQMHHQQQLPPNNRLDSLYDSRLDDRNFVPDGMVPGLRQAAPPRSRESNGMFADPMDDSMQFNPHRLPPQQRGLDHSIFPSGAPSMYAQQGGLGRSTGIPLQQPQFRGNTPPNPLQGAQQRLPPGLANLGARPPHEPSQFISSSHGMQQSSGIHGPVHGNGPSPQPFNNFSTNGGLGGGNLGGGLGGFVGNPQMRGPLPAHQIPNSLAHNQMGHPSGTMDIRGPTNQAQLLSLGGGPNIGGLRGVGGGFGPPGAPGQMQTPLLAMRQQQQQQQQQQHLPPHMMPHPGHQIPPHLQRPVSPDGTQDLIALLLNGHT